MNYDYLVSVESPAAGSTQPADQRLGEWLAGVLEDVGKRVCRLWLFSDAERARLAVSAHAMVMVCSAGRPFHFPPEYAGFHQQMLGSGGAAQAPGGQKLLIQVFFGDRGNFAGDRDLPGVRLQQIDLAMFPSLARKREKLLQYLGVPIPPGELSGGAFDWANPHAPWLDVFCAHCGAANRALARYCSSCGLAQTEPLPVRPSGVFEMPVGFEKPCPRCSWSNPPAAQFCIGCGAAFPGSSPTPVVPAANATGLLGAQTLLGGRYRIVGQVGKGGFGAVYQVEDTQFGDRLLAVKEMSQAALSPAEVAEAVEAFKREALLLARLMNQHLPRVYEHFSAGGRWYLVMDYIEGLTLEDYLARQPGGRLPVEEALDYGQQLCDVLDYLHVRAPAAPIVFRDLKPTNIMRAADGHLYLIDFGIARHFVPGQAKDTAALGSTGYAAPEQYGKEQTTARADLYALGATLHQLLSGDDPSESPFQFRSLAQVPGLALPSGLGQLVAQLVEMDKGKRPANAALVKQALKSIAAGRGLPPALGGVPASPSTQATGAAAPTTRSTSAPAVVASPVSIPASSPGGTVPARVVIPPAHPAAPARAAFPYAWSVCPLISAGDATFQAALRRGLDSLSRLFYPLDILTGWTAAEALAAGLGERAVGQAELIVPLLSPAFLASGACTALAELAMKRHRKGEALVVPALAAPCIWEPLFPGIIPLPDETQPISKAADLDEAWERVRIGIRRRMVEFMVGGKTSGRMSLLQWALLMLYGKSYDRRFRTPNYVLKSSFPGEVSSGGVSIERASTGSGHVMNTYEVGSHTSPQLSALAQALGSPDGRPEDVLGDAY